MEQGKIHQALKKLCGSTVLEKSPQNIKILKFLVDQALKKEFVKEFSIGIALFGAHYKAEESTSKVRVAMYKFRKKLEQYYAEEGKNDEIIFVVKKGQYNLEFKTKKSLNKKKNRITLPFIATATIAIIVLVTFLVFSPYHTHSFWDYYFAPNSNNLCLVSDQFVFSQQLPEGNYQFITDNRINSEADLLGFQESKGDTSLKVANFSYTSKMAPIAINDIATWFTKHKRKITVKLESDFQFDDLSEHNLIFIGHYRNYQNAMKLFLKNSKVFKPHRNGFIYTHAGESIYYKNSFVDMNRTDYTMVSFMNLDKDKKALFIASNHDIGVIALSKKLSDPKQLKELYKHIPSKESNFNALFKVSGMKRTDIGYELLHIEIIP